MVVLHSVLQYPTYFVVSIYIVNGSQLTYLNHPVAHFGVIVKMGGCQATALIGLVLMVGAGSVTLGSHIVSCCLVVVHSLNQFTTTLKSYLISYTLYLSFLTHDILSVDGVSHNVWEECSGGGTCDRSTGICKCGSVYTGAACDRMICPVGEDSKVGGTAFPLRNAYYCFEAK